MHETSILTLIISFGLFLFFTSILQQFSKKTSFPYTVLLLISGLFAQLLFHLFGHTILEKFELDLNIQLSTDVIFLLLLPILLFEGAIHINLHQFRLQFKTITFLSTFALLVSIFVVGVGLAVFLGIPFGEALLFGAIISSTDPIAVLALFKTLGVPKRLALIADGESMFNDATGVIAFKIILGTVIGSQIASEHNSESVTTATQQTVDFMDILNGLGWFGYVFVGSIFYGLFLSFLATKLIKNIHNDKVIETAITFGLALFSFASAEHFFHLSGVITCVIAGISLANFGQTKFSPGVLPFMEEFWEYMGFIAVSLVFFFAAYNLDALSLMSNPMQLLIVVVVVLIGRAISVYLGCWITNKTVFFKDEPNIPLPWQHIINWGGLRGVIPLILVATLPDNFEYKELFTNFTFAALLFTLFINGTTIKALIINLKLHQPAKREQIITEENEILEIGRARERLMLLEEDIDPKLLKSEAKKLNQLEKQHLKHLIEIAKSEDLKLSLSTESIKIERQTLEDLFQRGHINENVFFIFNSELDLQQDCLEYPDIYVGRGYNDGIYLPPNRSIHKNFIEFRHKIISKSNFLTKLLSFNQELLVEERFALLKARIITSQKVLEHFKDFERFLCTNKTCSRTLAEIQERHERLINKNKTEMDSLSKEYPQIVHRYQDRLIKFLISNNPSSH